MVQVQSVANSKKAEDTRVQFMLDILTGIKNNNVNKIPNYDPSHFEYLKKNLKMSIRDGKFVTELNISYKDLINVSGDLNCNLLSNDFFLFKAETKGRWWIVGSAFTGKLLNLILHLCSMTSFLGNLVGTARDVCDENKTVIGEQFSDKLLALAKKMRMNTDTRRTVFCITMSAEDYMDCAEKLVKLGTKNQTEREVVFVVTDCCMQVKYFKRVLITLSPIF